MKRAFAYRQSQAALGITTYIIETRTCSKAGSNHISSRHYFGQVRSGQVRSGREKHRASPNTTPHHTLSPIMLPHGLQPLRARVELGDNGWRVMIRILLLTCLLACSSEGRR
jgi:hypothetical protein